MQLMQLSKLSYYADFVVYPLVLLILTALGFSHLLGIGGTHWVGDAHWVGGAQWLDGLRWLGAGIVGLVFWTLLEYALHRVALHHMPYFSPMHGLHHASPLALIGTPTWMSVSILVSAVLIPAWLSLGFMVADGLTIGIMLGYFWYGTVHHVIHHRANDSSPSYFNDLRAWHLRHHYSPKNGNFGVTTRFWDHVFGTAIGAGGKAAISP